MELLVPGIDLNGFAERIETAPQRVLLLDYDGTLAPFKWTPARGCAIFESP